MTDGRFETTTASPQTLVKVSEKRKKHLSYQKGNKERSINPDKQSLYLPLT